MVNQVQEQETFTGLRPKSFLSFCILLSSSLFPFLPSRDPAPQQRTFSPLFLPSNSRWSSVELDEEVLPAQMPGIGAESLRAKQRRKRVTLSY